LLINPIRPLTNHGIEEDQDDPKEPAHLDYKYLKSFVGPMSTTGKHFIKEKQGNESSSEKEKEKE
jgi:hypothetical protein